MIDEKKLIEDLKQYFPDWKSSSVGCIVKSAVNKCIRIIKAQPQIDNCSKCSRRKFYQEGYRDGIKSREWFSISEKLPVEDCPDAEIEVIVTVKEDYSCEHFLESGFAIYNATTKTFHSVYGNRVDITDIVVAWKHLPAAYKGDKQND